MTAYVYLPDDEPDEALYNGVTFKLAPNFATEIKSPWKEVKPETIADHIAASLHMWGVVRTNGPVVDGKADSKEDQEIVDGAEKKYLAATLQWAGEILAKKKKRIEAHGGLDLASNDDEKKAEAWVKDNRKRLQGAGLLT